MLRMIVNTLRVSGGALAKERSGPLPDYLKVYTVPKDVQCDEDVIIEPIIRNLNVGDKDMEMRITEQMIELYEFFRKLYEQDQDEIRTLQAYAAQKDMEVRMLQRAGRPSSAHEEASPSTRSPSKSPSPPPQPQSQATPPQPAPQHWARSRPVLSLIVPPFINPAGPVYKWFANVHHAYKRRQTLWLGLFFLLLLLLAVGLLAGLLATREDKPAPVPPYGPGSPSVTGMWATGMTFSVNMSEGTTAFYALVPLVARVISNIKPTAADVRALLQGPGTSPLANMTVACGERTAVQTQQFTFAVQSSLAGSAAGSGGGGLEDVLAPLCSVEGALPGSCGVCPVVKPASSYILMVAFSGTDDLFELPVTTSQASTAGASSPPPSPSPPSQPITANSSSPAPLPPPGPSAPPSGPPSLPPNAPNFTLAPAAAAISQNSLAITLAVSSRATVRYVVMHSVLYAQIAGVFMSFGSADPYPGQVLSLPSASHPNTVGVNGIVAAGVVNATEAGVPYTISVDGRAAAGDPSCNCTGTACACVVPAPCQAGICDMGTSALTAGAAYKVFVSASTPDGSYVYGPVSAGEVTLPSDTTAPALAPSASLTPTSIAANGFALTGLALDSSGLAYMLVTLPTDQQQGVIAGSSTTFVEQPLAPRRRLAGSWAAEGAAAGRLGHGASRGLRRLQQAPQSPPTGWSGALVVSDPAPAAAVFTPSCPRSITCDTAQVVAAYLDSSVERLTEVRCVVLATTRDGPSTQVVAGLANDTAYVVRVVTQDAARNQRVYKSVMRTVDSRPPSILGVATRTGFRTFNLSVTLSEPGAVTGFLYTPTGGSNLSLVVPPTWPPTPQGAPVQQVTAATTTFAPAVPTSYLLTFDDPTLEPHSNYTVALVARDLPGNVQTAVRLVVVSTEDNIPPSWLAATVQAGAYNASLSVQLDEPATVHFFLMPGGAACPTAAQLFSALDSPSSTPAFTAITHGNLTTSDSATGGADLVGLFDSTNYTLCLVASDMSQQRNRQTTVRPVSFMTLDRTPPTLDVALQLSADSGNFTCDKTSFLCSLNLNVTLSEPGSAKLTVQNVPRLFAFNASSLYTLNITAPGPGVIRAGTLDFTAAGSQQLELSSLSPGRAYVLSIVASDSVGNLQPDMFEAWLNAPDIVPPFFRAASVFSTNDDSLTVNVTLNERCIVMCLVLPSGSPTPAVATVLANGTQQTYAPPNASMPITWDMLGLSPGLLYDVHMVATDAVGNQQAAVTSVLRVRTTDSTPPSLLNLTTTAFSPGNRFTISVNASKPGTLYFVGVRAGAPLPTRNQLLLPSALYAWANFSGSLAVPDPFVPTNVTLCVADGTDFQLWAVMEDLEGLVAERIPNYSTVIRATQLLLNSSTGSPNASTCSPEARMRALVLETSLAAGSLGWPLGSLTPVAGTGDNTSWVREFALVGGAGGAVGSDATVLASMEGVPLGSLTVTPWRPLPASISVVVQTPTLYLEPASAGSPLSIPGAPANAGRQLRFAFQLFDAARRTAISAAGIRISPSILSTLATSSDGRLALPDCNLTASTGSALLPGGAGVCSAEVSSTAFPAAGASATATLQVDVYNGTRLLASAAPLTLNLFSAPAVAASSALPPADGTALLVALPTRQLRAGEIFRATVAAAVSSRALTGFSVQLSFNTSRVEYLRSVASGLWSDLAAVALPSSSPGAMGLWASSLVRTDVDASYSSRTVPLMDAYFRLRPNLTAPDGTELTVLDVGSAALYPYEASPQARFQDIRAPTGGGSGGARVQLVTPKPLAVFAYMANHELFNTALLDGQNLTAPISALRVWDWAASGVHNDTLESPPASDCDCSPVRPSPGAFALEGCRVVLTGAQGMPVKQAAINMTCSGGAAAAQALQAQASVTVWLPGVFRVRTSDPDAILSSLLPINVPPPAGGCQDSYQSAQLSLLVTWINGGSAGAADVLSDVDVTPLLASWATDQPQALRLANATVTGLAPHPNATVSALGAGGTLLASTVLAVSATPVCIEGVDAVALSGVTVAPDNAIFVASSPGRFRVRFTPQQSLRWERATARVGVFAALGDGSFMPVARSATTAAVPLDPGMDGSAAGVPFRLQPLAGLASLNLQVNTTLGFPAVCGAFLRTSWAVCSGSGLGPLATGTGLVRVALPTPTAIPAVVLSSQSIASPGNGAAQPPIGIPTRVWVRVLVAFSDGQMRDMTSDPRIDVVISSGGDMCSLMRNSSTNEPYIEAVGSAALAGLGGACEVQARTIFADLTHITQTNRTTVVTFSGLQVFVASGAPALPPVTNSSVLTGQAAPEVPLRLFKCDFTHYSPASVWVMGKLSTCGSGCQLSDLNDPANLGLSLSDLTAVSLATNPANASLSNLLKPVAPGSSRLTVSFGSAVTTSFNVSVEDTFQRGWPRVVAILDTGFTVQANMTSAAFKVSYLVLRSTAPAPTPAQIESAGVALSTGTGGLGAFMLTDVVTGLRPATSYSVYLAVRYQSTLLGTVVGVTGVLTPDHVAPTLVTVGAMSNLTADNQRFLLRLPVGLSEAGTVAFALYRNESCLRNSDQVPVATVLAAAALPGAFCGCSDTTLCQPVAWGNVSLSDESRLNDTLTLGGLLPPNPYEALRDTAADDLTCNRVALPSPVSATHLLYVVAQDDLPTYRDWNVTCVPPAFSPGSECAAVAAAPCTAAPPASGASGPNVQALPYTQAPLSDVLPLQGAASRPVLSSFDVPRGDDVAFVFTNITTSRSTASGKTVAFDFRVNKVSAVQYRLQQFDGTPVSTGIVPVYDPSVPYRITISRTCGGLLLQQSAYSLWYWVTDVYGGTTSPSAAVAKFV
ncbi:hypothetical protein HYH03_005780 [Edaphochlamys debaryana]|uniref:Uncharacterized protein n=1 Tax=Edaphochlamys debaryana TaxID=47281 RepID=A0A836C0Y1_9CHLO|nr:hypothetical protein HYH03_005780 [Edaphochlamys debaryana]|eukprot:KAG2496180.1 hypothetical protein HYH03_005780 [Edaphochlamys debaryana]